MRKNYKPKEIIVAGTKFDIVYKTMKIKIFNHKNNPYQIFAKVKNNTLGLLSIDIY